MTGNHHTIMIDECPHCHGEGRSLGAPAKWGDGSPTDYGPCRTCGGSGELEQEFECRTLEDLDEEDEQRIVSHQNNPLSEILSEALKKNES